jgi:hypothetical protein
LSLYLSTDITKKPWQVKDALKKTFYAQIKIDLQKMIYVLGPNQTEQIASFYLSLR